MRAADNASGIVVSGRPDEDVTGVSSRSPETHLFVWKVFEVFYLGRIEGLGT
jgi:hypothetical protein